MTPRPTAGEPTHFQIKTVGQTNGSGGYLRIRKTRFDFGDGGDALDKGPVVAEQHTYQHPGSVVVQAEFELAPHVGNPDHPAACPPHLVKIYPAP